LHELAITRSLLGQALAEAGQHGANRITRINLLVGEQGSVVPDCVRFYFDELKKGTPAEAAELEFRTAPLRIRCPKCGGEFGKIEEMCSCNAGGEVVSGQELVIESIDIE
jgi:hydrogenase nickel incorporation protein HypA/HybF